MMQQKSRTYRRPKAKRWPLWVIIGALAVGGAAFGLLWVNGTAQGKSPTQFVAAIAQAATGKQAATPAAPAYQTTPVRRSDLSLSATGTGKVVPNQTVDLSFAASGNVAQLNVQVGDQVTAGQVLAVQQGTDALKQAVDQKQLDLITAQNALDQLTSNSAINLAQASATVASAQQALVAAQNNVHDPHDPRCAPSLTQKYYSEYESYVIQASPWVKALNNSNTGYSRNYILQNLYPIQSKENQAYYNWQWCQNYTDLEIQASKASLQVAQANLNQAQSSYQALQANKGIDPNALALAQATLLNAQKQFDVAKANLDGATIVAPISGTVTAVNGVVGQTVCSPNGGSSNSNSNGSASANGASTNNSGSTSSNTTGSGAVSSGTTGSSSTGTGGSSGTSGATSGSSNSTGSSSSAAGNGSSGTSGSTGSGSTSTNNGSSTGSGSTSTGSTGTAGSSGTANCAPTSSSSTSSGSTSSGSSSSNNSSSTSSSSALITITDMTHPQVQVNIDETDLPNFAVNCPAQIVFNALPNQTFTGTVAQVYPALVTVNNSSEAQGLIKMAQQAQSNGQPFPIGLDATVTVTCQQVNNALVVPVQALRQDSNQNNYVYLLNTQGQPEKREVQVGIRTTAFAEIKGGLQAGDEVITSPVK